MKKLVSALALCAVTVTMVAGCGKKNNDIDAITLATQLKDEVKYAETLNEVSENVAKKRYGLGDDEVSVCVSFKGTSAVVDEIAVIKTDDSDSVKEKMESYRDNQIKSYKSYLPSEVPKLEKAVLQQYGDAVVYCACDDTDKVQSVISDYMGK